MRWERVIKLIEERPGIAPADLAACLGVSGRTVRSDVQRANERLTGIAHIEHRRGGGYTLTVEDGDRLAALWASSHARNAKTVPSSPRERISYLVNDLVQRTTWVTLDELASTLFVSRGSLSADIQRVEEILDRFDLSIERRPRYGMRVVGSELNKRFCLAASVMDGELPMPERAVVGAQDSKGDVSWLRALGVRREALERVEQSVKKVLDAADFHINVLVYHNLITHIAIALLRIEGGSYVPFEGETLANIISTREFQIAREIAEEIESRLEIELPDAEIAYIAIHLAGKQTAFLSDQANKDVEDTGGLVISDEIWSVVTEILDRIWDVFRFDFRSDLELRMNLARHIVPLSVRLRYHMDLKNPLLADITTRYLLAWSMALEVSDVFKGAYGTVPSHDEMGYIALAFALALERSRGAVPRKNLLVVCASGAGSARLLEHRCRREFGEFIDTVISCDVMHVADMDFTDIDYVFTTVPLPVSVPVPVRQVTFFFDSAEGERMRYFLRNGPSDDRVLGAFSPTLFFPHLTCASKHEVLGFLCERAEAVRGDVSGLLPLVLKREEAAPTSYGNGVAMPHPLEAVSDDTFVTVGLLDEPVVWDERGTEVRAVFLISFSRSGGAELDAFFNSLADFFVDDAALAKLVDEQRWETLVDLLTQLNE